MVSIPCRVVSTGLFRFALLPARNPPAPGYLADILPAFIMLFLPCAYMQQPANPYAIWLGGVLGFSLEIILIKHLTRFKGFPDTLSHQVD
jgi:hypothetical protein